MGVLTVGWRLMVLPLALESPVDRPSPDLQLRPTIRKEKNVHHSIGGTLFFLTETLGHYVFDNMKNVMKNKPVFLCMSFAHTY